MSSSRAHRTRALLHPKSVMSLAILGKVALVLKPSLRPLLSCLLGPTCATGKFFRDDLAKNSRDSSGPPSANAAPGTAPTNSC
jgi:hypothetical protein